MTGDLVGTLRYMSPEQALAKRGVVDHRTDVYSLGATLYELLTLRAGLQRAATGRSCCGRSPSRSRRPPRRLNKAIPAELETIVLKAMAKNPAERYATAQELADDLRRFLDDKPIRARPAGAGAAAAEVGAAAPGGGGGGGGWCAAGMRCCRAASAGWPMTGRAWAERGEHGRHSEAVRVAAGGRGRRRLGGAAAKAAWRLAGQNPELRQRRSSSCRTWSCWPAGGGAPAEAAFKDDQFDLGSEDRVMAKTFARSHLEVDAGPQEEAGSASDD